jgi:1-acyl-sn-glycerol-3-phosphate acyltransferase
VIETFRAAGNSLILPSWTVLCVSSAVCLGALKRDKDLFYRWQREWGRGLFKLCGVDLNVSGQEHMPPGQNYIVVANHASYMDIPALFAGLPTTPQFIAKRELARIPFVGAALRHGRHVLVERGNRSSARDSLEYAASHVRKGATILVFPEGTRTDTGEVGQFKTGAFRLAKQAGAAILPVGIWGTRQVLPKHGRLLRPHPVSVHIGEALPAERVSSEDVKSLSRAAQESVVRLSRAARDDVAARTSPSP